MPKSTDTKTQRLIAAYLATQQVKRLPESPRIPQRWLERTQAEHFFCRINRHGPGRKPVLDYQGK